MRFKKILIIAVCITVLIICVCLIKSGFADKIAAANLNITELSGEAAGETTKASASEEASKAYGAETEKLQPEETAGKQPVETAKNVDNTPNMSLSNTELEVYRGPVRHVFFHPLIIYPERSFVGGRLSKGFNDWFVTVSEFRKIIESIYNNNYILVNMDSVCSIEEANGVKTVKRNEMLLPKGKKPLVISIDDMNYYDYMLENGCAERLVSDSDGYLAVESKNREGVIKASYDDVVPIVDEFVRQHPDFSFNGAKGIIALTGYEGILGYRTNKSDSPEYEADKEQAGKLVKMLKDSGWSFASHGYGHLDAVKVSSERLKRDSEKWRKEVEPLIGKTSVYIYPYGSSLKFDDDRFKILKDYGFSIFCGVGPDGSILFKGDFAYLERKSIDGLSIYYNSPYLKDLFDCSAVLDKARPDEY